MLIGLSLLAFAIGVLVGRISVRHYRLDRIAWAQRRLQLKVLSLELKSLRSKVVSAQGRRTPPAQRRLARKLPTLKWWQRRLIAWLRLHFPWLTRFMRFSPGTYIRWLQAKSRKGHALKIAEGKSRGRPPTPQFVVDAIVAIKRDNPRYSAGHIARMISGGELKFRISKQTVAQILKAHGFKPRPKGKRPPREEEPGWLTTLYNQHVMAIDFKITGDLAGNRLAVFNLIDHGRRVLHWSRATYNPTAEWVQNRKGRIIMRLREDQRAPGFVYVMRNLDPTWYNRIKVGLSLDPIERGRQLYTTGVPFPFVPYYAWAVTDMAYAEHIAHVVLADHRLLNSREHFDVIPVHRRMAVLDTFTEPTEDEVLVCLDTLLELIEVEYQCSNLLEYYSVDVAQLNDYSRQRKRTAKDPSNPDAYGPLF